LGFLTPLDSVQDKKTHKKSSVNCKGLDEIEDYWEMFPFALDDLGPFFDPLEAKLGLHP